ncbi:MAG: DNA repair protein RecO [Bacteroidota bacterium]
MAIELYKTRGIVLRSISYSDTSIIIKIYTELFGLQSYILKGAKIKNAKIKATLFQPLALLELVVYKKEKKHIQFLKEANVEYFFTSIHYEPVKTSIIFFLNEVLLKSIHEEEKNTKLFSFIHHSLQTLDSLKSNFINFHLIFLIQLTKYLGFFPRENFSETTPVFDMREGKFVETIPLHTEFISLPDSKLFYELLSCNYDSENNFSLSYIQRKKLLNALLLFYRIHISSMENILSHEVLSQF